MRTKNENEEIKSKTGNCECWIIHLLRRILQCKNYNNNHMEIICLTYLGVGSKSEAFLHRCREFSPEGLAAVGKYSSQRHGQRCHQVL